MNLNAEMIEKAKAAKTAEELYEIAKANGVEMTADEAKSYFAQLNPKSGELDDDDLDTVAGGSDVSCACAMGGGGTKDTNDKTCACVLAGVGYEKDGSERCLCGFAGYGYDT